MSHDSGNARRIPLDGVFNCRDLGGYPCAGGKTTQFGRFIRCGIPFGPMGPDRAGTESQRLHPPLMRKSLILFITIIPCWKSTLPMSKRLRASPYGKAMCAA